MDNETTLIAVADAASARLFIRRGPGAPLEELALPTPTVAVAKNTREAEICDDGEILCDTPAHAFLLTAAASVEQAVKQFHASRLVLCAPAHVLCAIRDGLDRTTRHLLACELTRNVAREPVMVIDTWLSEQRI